MERTWGGPCPILSPRWLNTSRKGPQFSIFPIKTSGATLLNDQAPVRERRSVDSPSPNTPDSEERFTPCPPPSTAFATPVTSPVRDQHTRRCAKGEEPACNSFQGEPSSESKVDVRNDAHDCIWTRRYFDVLAHYRILDEQMNEMRQVLQKIMGLYELQ